MASWKQIGESIRNAIGKLPGFLSWAEFTHDKNPSQRPEQGYYSSGIRDDYLIDSAARELTPERVARIFSLADQGYTYDLFDMYDQVETDPHVTAVLGRRRDAVTGRKLEIMAGGKGHVAEEAADLCRELVIGDDQGVDGIADWPSALFNMTDAIGKAVSLNQIAWQVRGGVFVPGALVRWPQRELILGFQPDISMMLGNDPDQIRIRTRDNLAWGEPLDPRWNWIVHIQKCWTTHLSRAALMKSITWFWLFKRFSFRDWCIFLERYGMPMRVGKYHKDASQAERDGLLKSVLELGRDAACIMPQQSTIELLQSTLAAATAEPHERMKDACNDEISRACWGNSMSADQGERGARSAKEAYSADERCITDKDCRNLAETIRRELFTPCVRLNLGDNVPIPKCQLIAGISQNMKERAEVDKILVSDIHLPLSKKQMYEVYERAEPEGDDDRLEAPKPAPNPFARPGLPAPGEEAAAEGEDGAGDAALPAKKNGKGKVKVPVAGKPDEQGKAPVEPNAANGARLDRMAAAFAMSVAEAAQLKKQSVDWLVAKMIERQKQAE